MNNTLQVLPRGENPEKPVVEQKEHSLRSKVARAVRHTLGLLFWTYVLLKLFVVDIDTLLVSRFFPQAGWLVEYRSVIILGFAAVLAVVTWNPKLLGWVLYVLFYPFIFGFWHVPAWLIRHRAWVLSVALVAAMISALRSMRFVLIVTGTFAVGTLCIAAASRDWLLVSGCLMLMCCLVSLYTRTISSAFKSSLDIFSSQRLDKIWPIVSKGIRLNEELRGLDPSAMTEQQRNQWISNLQISILYGRACYFVADKLHTLRQGQITAAIAAAKVAALFFAAVAVFWLMSLGLYRLDHSQYVTSAAVRAFDFLWYSFQATFHNSVQELVPVGLPARSLFILQEVTTALILFVIVAFFLTEVQAARNADQMDAMVDKIRDHARTSEAFVSDQFGLTLGKAIDELVRLRANLIGLIFQLSPDLKPPDSEDSEAA